MHFEYCQHKGLNNRAENAHQPIANLFHFSRNSMTATNYRALRTEAMSVWADLAAAAA